MKKKVLFLIHDLAQGGAEKVLVNLANYLNPDKYDVTVHALFGGGVNQQFLKPHVKYNESFKKAIRGNSKLMKILTPKQLYSWLIKDRFDIVVAYLEGPSARIISGCQDPKVKRISWVHITQKTTKCASKSFRSYHEAMVCYGNFDKLVAVSESVKKDFDSLFPGCQDTCVLYNTNDTNSILEKVGETHAVTFSDNQFNIVQVGKIENSKGFDRLIPVVKKLCQSGISPHVYILGIGPEKAALQRKFDAHKISKNFTFLGYQENPYAVISKADLFVCSSHREGFSTATTEALILGVPVVATNVGGMKEMLGNNNEYGVVVENDVELTDTIVRLANDPQLLEYYRRQSMTRGKDFGIRKTVQAVEEMFDSL